jgi:hypothetical protein
MTQIAIPISGKVIAIIDGELTAAKKCEAVLVAEMEANASGAARLHLSLVVESELTDRVFDILVNRAPFMKPEEARFAAREVAKGLLV